MKSEYLFPTLNHKISVEATIKRVYLIRPFFLVSKILNTLAISKLNLMPCKMVSNIKNTGLKLK